MKIRAFEQPFTMGMQVLKHLRILTERKTRKRILSEFCKEFEQLSKFVSAYHTFNENEHTRDGLRQVAKRQYFQLRKTYGLRALKLN